MSTRWPPAVHHLLSPVAGIGGELAPRGKALGVEPGLLLALEVWPRPEGRGDPRCHAYPLESGPAEDVCLSRPREVAMQEARSDLRAAGRRREP